jgi:hypothetical protein
MLGDYSEISEALIWLALSFVVGWLARPVIKFQQENTQEYKEMAYRMKRMDCEMERMTESVDAVSNAFNEFIRLLSEQQARENAAKYLVNPLEEPDIKTL